MEEGVGSLLFVLDFNFRLELFLRSSSGCDGRQLVCSFLLFTKLTTSAR